MSGGDVLRFLLGLGLLIGGAELLVRGASRLATALGISPLVVGLTVVAFGTGSPELAVALRAASGGQPDIALGNVVGSNIFNILFILGISAALAPLVVAHQLVRLDVPIMIGASVLLLVISLDRTIGRTEGVVLLACIVAYTWFLIRLSRRQTRLERRPDPFMVEEDPPDRASLGRAVLAVVIGLALLVLGSRFLVGGAVGLARTLQVSELVIALTVVAAGTSLPEVATSIVAGLRGQRDIAVGNVVGSNIYNILLVVGAAGVIAPDGLMVPAAALHFDIPVMLAAAVACLPIFFANYEVRRWEGLLFVGYWAVYTLYLIMNAAGHDALPAFSRAVTLFAIPLTVVTFAVITFRAVRRRSRSRPPT